ncbi:MAG: BsaA family SipW-dependent biofilm matrix protein, partial [Culicoidibacterales bacterium]
QKRTTKKTNPKYGGIIMTSKQKKIAAGALAAFLAVGGTAAFFTSSDLISNPFQTGTTTDTTDPNAGIDIWEKFNKDENYKNYDTVTLTPATEVLPGEAVNKDVQVRSTANYNQFIRAQYEVVGFTAMIGSETEKVATLVKSVYTDKALTDTTAKIIGYKLANDTIVNLTGDTLTLPVGAVESVLDISLVSVQLKTSGAINTDTWSAVASDGWYYYNKILAPNAATTDLLDSVTLAGSAGNIYKNLGYTVDVKAESIQATPTAWTNSVADGGWAQTSTAPTAVDGN